MLALIGAMIFFLPHLMEHTATGELRGLPICGYGVMVMLGVVGAVALAVYRGQLWRHLVLVYSLALWLFIGGIAGARAFYVIEYWRDQFVVHNADGSFNLFATLGAVINIPQGGLVSIWGRDWRRTGWDFLCATLSVANAAARRFGFAEPDGGWRWAASAAF